MDKTNNTKMWDITLTDKIHDRVYKETINAFTKEEALAKFLKNERVQLFKLNAPSSKTKVEECTKNLLGHYFTV